MKQLLYFLPILIVLSCSDIDKTELFNKNLANRPIIPINESYLFNLNEVPSITLEFTVEEWNKLLQNYDLNPANDKKVVSKFSFFNNGSTIELDSIGLRLRGNTSRRRPEGSNGELHNAVNPDWHHSHFALDFSKNRVTQRFIGLNKMNLKWFKDDASYCREIYSYDLFRRFGCWNAPRASYCKVSIKIEGDLTTAYFGVYAMVENIDEDFLLKNQSKWGSATGFLWKGGWSGYNNANFVSTASIGVENVSINPALSVYFAYDLKTRKNELAAANTELVQFITDLNTRTGIDFKNWITQKMDIPLFLKTYATNVMLGMWDDYWVNGNNFFFYFAPNGKAYFIPYDYDNTLGTSGIVNNSGTQNPLSWGNMSQRPLITKILAIPEYQTLYKNYITKLASVNYNYFAVSKSIPRIQAWQTRISGFVANDTGEDMIIEDKPAPWANQPNYRLLSGNNQGGNSGTGNYFWSRTSTIPW